VDACVQVHPNNPDGALLTQATVRKGHKLTVVDESFGEVADESFVGLAKTEGVVVLRSFGKFYGLAGLRLGFAIAAPKTAAAMAEKLGPWAVSGPAIVIGTAALKDTTWQAATRARLAADTARLRQLGQTAGWAEVGGCDLFWTFEVGDARAEQDRLASHGIWTRRFDYAPGWLRLGLPGTAAGWARLQQALS
jgi:cobalamin biosynthetic protein CobC